MFCLSEAYSSLTHSLDRLKHNSQSLAADGRAASPSVSQVDFEQVHGHRGNRVLYVDTVARRLDFQYRILDQFN